MRAAWRSLVLLGLLLAAFWLLAPGAAASASEVVVLRVKGAISPPVVHYVERGIGAGEERGAAAVVIQLDTPGGLDEAMRSIIQRIVNARVPVIVYVSPAGARAASAGTFIAMAAHVAAMAPGTELGAAHPVAMGEGGVQEVSSTMAEKVTNDAAAYIRSLAEMRGRNADWAEDAVRKSASLQASEALAQRVVDLVAADLQDLLKQVDGRTVQMLVGTRTLSVADAQLRYVNMSLSENFLFTISNPNLAFILLSLAMLALFFELSNPGAIFPGVMGGILLLLSLYSLGTLPVNWAGVLLLFLSFGLFVAEIFVTSHGMLVAGGLVALVIGGMMLFSSAPPMFQVDMRVIGTVATAVGVYFAFVIRAIVRARLRKPSVGYEDMLGKVAVARSGLTPRGTVFLSGEYWQAECEDGNVEVGEEVVVTQVQGLKLRVVKKKEG